MEFITYLLVVFVGVLALAVSIYPATLVTYFVKYILNDAQRKNLKTHYNSEVLEKLFREELKTSVLEGKKKELEKNILDAKKKVASKERELVEQKRDFIERLKKTEDSKNKEAESLLNQQKETYQNYMVEMRDRGDKERMGVANNKDKQIMGLNTQTMEQRKKIEDLYKGIEERDKIILSRDETIKSLATSLQKDEFERLQEVVKQRRETIASLEEEKTMMIENHNRALMFELDVLRKQLTEEFNAAIEKIKDEKQRLEKQNDSMQVRYEALEKNFQTRLNKELKECILNHKLGERVIHEMYKREEAGLQERQEIIRKTEIMQDIENKVIDSKNVDILTREGELQLQINSSKHEIEKSLFSLKNETTKFALDKRDFEYAKKVEHDRWEIKKELDLFNIERQKNDLKLFAERLTDNERKREIQNLIDRHDLTTKETQQRFDAIAVKLEDEKRKHELMKIVDTFDIEKKKVAFIQAKEKFVIQMEQEKQNLQARINKLEDENRKQELQKKIDKLDINEKRAEINELKRSLESEKDTYEIQKKIDEFDFEMKKENHKITALNDELGMREKKFDIEQDKAMMKLHNEKLDIAKKAFESDYKNKEQLLKIRIEKGDLEAKTLLYDVQQRHDELARKFEDLKMSEREFDLLVGKKEQELVLKELNYKQDILYAFYDEEEEKDPRMISSRFSKMGYIIESPYKKQLAYMEEENQSLRGQLMALEEPRG